MNTNMNACKMAHEIKKATGCDLSTAFKAAYKAIKAATTKTTFTRADIDRIYTDIIAKYTTKGYIIRTTGMSGSQGEIAHIDMTNGTEVIRILMTDERSFTNHIYDTQLKIIVGISDVTNSDLWSTIWNNKLTIVEEHSWYCISENWFVTEAEIDAINDKAMARAEIRWSIRDAKESARKHEYNSEAAKAIVLGYVRNQKGFKGVKVSDITKITRIESKIYITVKGKTITIGK